MGRFIALLLAASSLWPAGVRAATLTVNTFADDFAINGNCSLREALASAVSDAAVDGCAAGSGADVIVLQAAGSYTFNSSALINGNTTVTIQGNRSAGGPGAFVIDLGFIDRFLQIQNGAQVTLENMTVTLGEPHFEFGGCLVARQASLTLKDMVFSGCVAPRGGALYWNGTGTNALVVERTTFQGNTARFVVGAANQMFGGAVALEGANTATALFDDVEFLDNLLDCLGPDCASGFGGALHAFAFDSAELTFRRVAFINNRMRFDSTEFGTGGAAYLQSGTGHLTFEDGFFSGNGIEGGSEFQGASALQVDASGTSRLDRLRFVGNDQGVAGRFHVDLRADFVGSMVVTNLLLAKGPAKGLALQSSGTASLLAGNLTVTGHGSRGVQAFQAQTSSLRIDNSIVWSNGTDAIEIFDSTPFLDPSNFIGQDPLFVNPAANDFDLQFTSPARDNGNGALASVQKYDALHRVRIVGPTIDRGAFERNALFSDDFEGGDAGAWSSKFP